MSINYFDNASTTKVDSKVIEAMLPFFSENYGNASSYYDFGKESKQAIELSRKQVSKLINCNEVFETLVFLSERIQKIQ